MTFSREPYISVIFPRCAFPRCNFTYFDSPCITGYAYVRGRRNFVSLDIIADSIRKGAEVSAESANDCVLLRVLINIRRQSLDINVS